MAIAEDKAKLTPEFYRTGYVDSSLMGSGQFDKAAILSYDFSDVEAQSPTFQISKEEIAGLKAAFDKPGSAFETGFVVGGDKFVAIKADDRSLYGKKGKEGIVVVKAVSCVMVAHHGEAVQTTNAATVVENLVDYINNPR
ncbi:profilin [Aspergillus fumigatus]